MYIGYHSNPTRLCVLTTQIHSQMKAKMWLSSLQGLTFTRELSTYKYKTSKIRKHKKKYENEDECATFKINHIGHPKLGIPACHSCGGITTR